ncbi:MAG: hypothetical protein DI568_18020 [Sphingomonas sp.]|nr:MAG: hypothetical protein DI568_18020 [Sphingomonas sp.]
MVFINLILLWNFPVENLRKKQKLLLVLEVKLHSFFLLKKQKFLFVQSMRAIQEGQDIAII